MSLWDEVARELDAAMDLVRLADHFLNPWHDEKKCALCRFSCKVIDPPDDK